MQEAGWYPPGMSGSRREQGYTRKHPGMREALPQPPSSSSKLGLPPAPHTLGCSIGHLQEEHPWSIEIHWDTAHGLLSVIPKGMCYCSHWAVLPHLRNCPSFLPAPQRLRQPKGREEQPRDQVSPKANYSGTGDVPASGATGTRGTQAPLCSILIQLQPWTRTEHGHCCPLLCTQGSRASHHLPPI